MDPKVHAPTSSYRFVGGKAVGFVFSYALSTTILYTLLYTTEKLPATWTWMHIAGIVGIITLSGIGLKRVFL